MTQFNTVTVFSFHTFPLGTELPQLARFKATLDTIQSLNGAVLQGTAQVVEKSMLDAEGCYRRLASGWGELPQHFP